MTDEQKKSILDAYNSASANEDRYADSNSRKSAKYDGVQYGIEKTIRALGMDIKFDDNGNAIDIR